MLSSNLLQYSTTACRISLVFSGRGSIATITLGRCRSFPQGSIEALLHEQVFLVQISTLQKHRLIYTAPQALRRDTTERRESYLFHLTGARSGSDNEGNQTSHREMWSELSTPCWSLLRSCTKKRHRGKSSVRSKQTAKSWIQQEVPSELFPCERASPLKEPSPGDVS